MSSPENNPLEENELEAMLTETFGPPPSVDIDAWCKRYPSALAWLNPQRLSMISQRRKRMNRIVILTATAAAAICVWLGIAYVGTNRLDDKAFAQTVEQIQKAKTVTWKWTVYKHATSKDGKRTWLTTETREMAYRAPGLCRETSVDNTGQVKWVTITDSVRRKKLDVSPETKEATFSEADAPFGGPNGPFEWVNKELKDANLQWVETRKTALGEVNVFRHAFRDQPNGRDWSYDFWIDQKTKRLVEVHIPGADIYDAYNDPASNVPPEKEWSGTLLGSVEHDVVFDADLGDSLFRFEPPEGYTVQTVQTKRRGQVTEKEMIDYLGVVAGFNDKTFPDQVFPVAITSDRVNKAWYKPEKDRTAAEQKLVETTDHYMRKFQRSMPIGLFVEDQAVENSFRYLGKGVKLGDKDRIVWWYKLKDAKAPNTYRVVYGDLSVKDVASKDLPLPVEP